MGAPVNAPPPTAPPRPPSAPPPHPVRPPAPQQPHPQQVAPPPRGPWPGAAAGAAPRTPDKPVERGWRRMVRSATFGLVKPGPSAAQRDAAQFEATIRTALRGNHKVGVLGKGGVGKTSVAASVGSILAELRQQDRVVAIDADTAFGRLSSRIDPRTTGSFWELTADKNLQSFADVTSRVGRNATGLYVLGGEPVTGPRRVLDPAIYREAALRLDRHFAISVIDCGSTMDAAVTREVLRDLDALIVVSSPWADGAAAAAKTVEWLSDHDLGNLLQRSVVVLNDSDGHADKRTRSLLAREFIDHGQPVVEVPFDPHLRPGGVIDVTQEMGPATRLKFLQVAATITGYFASRTQDSAGANPPDPVRPGAPTGPPSPRSW
ncbi:MinD/ParA family ATP-binding protein [Mycobacterium sp. 23]|uniref:MinD/ParA family ATP-binding protein n=1 Tax=Mycobacterium sp. 23 TaxID=3400424 RepID=UPI003AAB9F31